MADNTTLNAGTGGDVMSTDDIGGSVKVQRVKLMLGADGANDGDASSTNPLPILQRKDTVPIAVVSGGLTTSVTAYVAGDQVGTQFTIANAARVSGGTGRIVAVSLLDVNDMIGAYDVVFFTATATPATDNTAFSVSDADAAKIVGAAQLAGAYDFGGNRFLQAYNLSVPYNCAGGTSLFAMLITRFGHTFFGAVTDLTLTVWVERD